MFKPVSAFAIAAMMMPAAAYAQMPLDEGSGRTGQLTTDSQRITENDYYLDLYTVSGQAGERIAITMRSDEFDTLLEIGREGDYGFEQLAMDDDGAGELNSRLVFTFPQSGEYLVRARTYGANTTGTYMIEMERIGPPTPPPPPMPIALGETVTGELTVDSPAYDADGYGGSLRHYALYSIAGNAGDEVTITLRSEDFDAFLEVGGITPLGFSVGDSNDDGEARDGEEPLGLDSRLTVTFAFDGVLTIRATTLGGGATGAYSLTVD